MSFEGLKKNNSRSFIYGRSSTKPAKFEHGLPIGLAPFFLLLIIATSVDHCMHLSFMFTYLFYLLTDLRDIVNTIRNFGCSVGGSSDTAFRYRYFNNFSPDRGAEYCDEPVCLSLCVCVCLSAIISRELHVLSSKKCCACYHSCGSVLLWQRSDTPCTSGFMDDIIFAHKPLLLDVAAQLKRSAHAALGFAINCAQ